MDAFDTITPAEALRFDLLTYAGSVYDKIQDGCNYAMYRALVHEEAEKYSWHLPVVEELVKENQDLKLREVLDDIYFEAKQCFKERHAPGKTS